jgi:hypothetical protein
MTATTKEYRYHGRRAYPKIPFGRPGDPRILRKEGPVLKRLILALAITVAVDVALAMEAELKEHDWVVTNSATVRNRHIVLDGNLVLERGGVLELDNCTLEIVGKGSREHLVDWRGGRLVTRNTVIGGKVVDGVPIHTVFHIYDGEWDAIDTTVQYAYGFSFHAETRGVLRATRLRAGPRPDAVIASGKADITLVDSTFPLALGVYTNKGGKAVLDLPVGEPIDRVFDHTNMPGVEYTVRLTRHVVPHQWFVFLRRIEMNKPPCEVVLRNCPRVIVSLLGWNVQGEVQLSEDLAEPIRLANVTLRKADKPVGVSMWCVYFSGKKLDLTVRGPGRIAELMHRGGRMRLEGGTGRHDLVIGCTTLEMSNDARMELENVYLGRPLTWTKVAAMGEVNVGGQARMEGRNVGINRVVFHTRESGEVALREVYEQGPKRIRQEGGPVRITPAKRLP